MGISTEYRITMVNAERDAPLSMVERSLEDAQKSYDLLRSVAFRSDEKITVKQITTRVEESDVTDYLEAHKSEYTVDTIVME